MFSPRIRKAISMFLLVDFLSSTLGPTISYALTSGPTAPEFTSFEPVDTTNMVNLNTGDFTYSTPLIEVPGPEGGYPLALSYHAGIMPNEESSWIGLGWTLNPGAINRSVNGYADDHQQAIQTVKDYWDGGVTKTHTVGVSVGYKGVSLSVGRTTSHDTYQGVSRDWSGGIGYSFNPLSELVSAAGRVPKEQLGHTSNVNGITPGNYAVSSALDRLPIGVSMGASIHSKGMPVNASVAGHSLSKQSSPSNAVAVALLSSDTQTMPLGPFSLTIAKNYYRYFSDETEATKVFGSLQAKQANAVMESTRSVTKGLENTQEFGFDAYAMQSFDSKETDPDKQLEGSLPSYDRYDVLGQGIGGSIQPYNFENGSIYRQSIYERDPDFGWPIFDKPVLKFHNLQSFRHDKINFRFENDFSNALTVNRPPITRQDPAVGNVFTVEPHTLTVQPDGFGDDGIAQHLAGSRHVDWYTNAEIRQSVETGQGGILEYSGYINNKNNNRQLSFALHEDYLQPEAGLPYTCIVSDGKSHRGTGAGSYIKKTYKETGSTVSPCNQALQAYYKDLKPRSVDISKQIGGFSVTNTSGVAYHYMLPVYNYNEYTRAQKKNPEKGASTFREYKNNHPYAYQWLLTALTGPDYVDREPLGQIGDEDWGYWVKFEYGRWADAYQWRTPHTGYQSDVDDEFESFSYGVKELYYLDAVETRTHKALFIKSVRKDGLGVTSRLEGGSEPRRFSTSYLGPDASFLRFNVSPVSTLKLDEIYLLKKEDLTSIPLTKASGEPYNEGPHFYPYSGKDISISHQYTYQITALTKADGMTLKYHNGDLVYDKYDIEGIKERLTPKALRIIKFNTDYSLCQNTPNSFGMLSDLDPAYSTEGDYYPMPEYIQPCSGASPYSYHYHKNYDFNMYSRDFMYFTGGFASCWDNVMHEYNKGKIKFARQGKLTLRSVQTLGKAGVNLIPPIAFDYEKNPNYGGQDMWNMYKSDFVSGTANRTSAASAQNVDAWSLSKITSPLGATIAVKYESDTYRSVYPGGAPLKITSMSAVEGTTDQVNIQVESTGANLADLIQVNDHLKLNTIIGKTTTNYASVDGGECQIKYPKLITFKKIANDIGDVLVKEVGSDKILVRNSTLYGYLEQTNQECSINIEVSSIRGQAFTTNGNNLPGGGVRVKSIEVSNPEGKDTYETEYTYAGGVTAYDPVPLPSIKDPEGYSPRSREFEKFINQPYEAILKLARELPAPGVLYESVKVQQKFNGNFYPSYQQYTFEVFRPEMVTTAVSNEYEHRNRIVTGREVQNNTEQSRTVTIKNYANRAGNLLSLVTFDKDGKEVNKVEYGYLHDGKDNTAYENALKDNFQNQGVIQQSFNEHRSSRVMYPSGSTFEFYPHIFDEKAIVTVKEEYPVVQTMIKTSNFKTGLKEESRTLAFDFYSGIPTKILSSDSYGNLFLTETLPAYRQYAGMGLKVKNKANKHMLSQTAASYSYQVNESNTPVGLLSASVQTWSDQVPVMGLAQPQTGVWRKQASYQWNGMEALAGDGTYPIADFTVHPFNWVNPEANSSWVKTGETTLYDLYSHELEARDMNENSAAVRMNKDQRVIIASASYAGYHEIAFSGAEYYDGNLEPEGGVNRGEGNSSTAHAHTGKYSLLVGFNSEGFNYILQASKANLAKKYRASVWVYVPGEAETSAELTKIELYCQVDGQEKRITPTLQKNKSKSWYLLDLEIPQASSGDIYVGCRNKSNRGVYFDDFRVRPLSAPMTAYVYDQASGELNYILDGNNFYTRFEYDGVGRLIRTSRELLNFDFGDGKESYRADRIINEVLYNYGKKK